ncbi:MAG: Hsp33 family molecular chaperone [Hyphomicrobiales bacterium]|nr:MAG: Hsp33 family molecular chaperone [Hyphomicrobiales bacterium]
MATAPAAADDLILPFRLENAQLRGKIIRLGGAITEIIARHDYPGPVSALLGEAACLAGLMGASLKFDGRFILQSQSDGPVSLMVADFATPGDLRAYARFDPAEVASGADMLGKGHLAFTIDQGTHMERYQGIVALEGQTLADAAHGYFERSEQIPTRIHLAAGPIKTGEGEGWRAGGIMLQHLPGEGGTPVAAAAEDWNRAGLLLKTVEAHELLDPTLAPEQLLYRLFHEEQVRVFDPQPLRAHCGCSEAGVSSMLEQFSADERAGMLDGNGLITVNCQFCSRKYHFSPDGFK